MRTAAIIMLALASMLIFVFAVPPGIFAQDSGTPEQIYRFGDEELTQMLAPIALYPDSLIAQILMASTYPLEVVEAERWVRSHSDLKGDELDAALQGKNWDPSVSSLCHFPDILFAMSDKLDQTRKLGDAYLEQPDDVMSAIQDLRRRARDQGNLGTTTEQRVINDADVIRIEPADPQVFYLPVYDPFCVYGPWWYPAYPPFYWYYPPAYIAGCSIGYSYGFFVGLDLFSWCWFDWSDRHIFVDYDHARRFFRHHRGDRESGKHYWRHDPVHRRGVAYRDRRTNVRFEPAPLQRSESGSEIRGYPTNTFESQTVGPSQNTIENTGVTTGPSVRNGPVRSRSSIERRGVTIAPSVRSGPVRSRSATERRETTTAPRGGATERPQSTGVQDTPFRGIGNGSFERRASERGAVSRRSENVRQDRGADHQTRGRAAGRGLGR